MLHLSQAIPDTPGLCDELQGRHARLRIGGTGGFRYNPAFFSRSRFMNLLLFLIAFGAGIAVSFQAAINSQMAAAVGANSVVAALVSFLCGTAVLAVVAFVRGGLPDALAVLPQQPLWKFSG